MPYIRKPRSPGGRRTLRALRPALLATGLFIALLFFLSPSVRWEPPARVAEPPDAAEEETYPFASARRPTLDYAADGLVKGFDGVHLSSKRAGVRATHPIDELRERGRRRWDALLRRQSKTLAHAVNEYRRRYSRDPPAGFDKWFAFCQEHDVKIVDDYDQIDRDVRMWLAVRPDEFRRRLDTLDAEKHQ